MSSTAWIRLETLGEQVRNTLYRSDRDSQGKAGDLHVVVDGAGAEAGTADLLLTDSKCLDSYTYNQTKIVSGRTTRSPLTDAEQDTSRMKCP